jgi:hypothetical protein
MRPVLISECESLIFTQNFSASYNLHGKTYVKFLNVFWGKLDKSWFWSQPYINRPNAHTFFLNLKKKKGSKVFTSVVRVNGLRLTLPVSVNPIMKFIHTSCKCIIFIYIHVNVESCKFILCCVKQCKCKYKNKYIYVTLYDPISKSIYIYMILHDYVKQGKY